MWNTPIYITRESWLALFDKADVTLLGEKFNKAALFDRYIQSQQAECNELENEIAAVTMLLQVNA